MDELRNALFPGSGFNEGTSIFILIIFALIAMQVLSNIWRWTQSKKQDEIRAENYRKELQASEKRIRDLFLKLEENRKSVLENLGTMSTQLDKVRQANQIENLQVQGLINKLDDATKTSKSAPKKPKKTNE